MPPEETAVTDTLHKPNTTVMETRGVTVRFGGVAALTDVNIAVKSGEVTGLIGPNGAGKTTLFNVISGLQRPNHGDVFLGGTDVTKVRPNKRATMGLARTFQRLELFGTLSAADNVRVGLEASDQPRKGDTAAQARVLLERVGAGGCADALVSTLPTGMARLVELARALSINPRVLLLDEPCSGLDEAETLGLGKLLTSLATEGRAILLVEHDTDVVLTVCDTIFVLDFGEVIASGKPADIQADPIVQAAYLGQAPGPEGKAGEKA